MFAFFANLFGYLLNFLYGLIQNYGLAIILFSVIIKIILLPISINQQRTMKKTMKVQEELKKLQVKNQNNPEALQRETMELYKREKVNPFGGCLSAIVQTVLLISVFFLVKSPLTYMKKIEPELIEKYTAELSSVQAEDDNQNTENSENGEGKEETKQEENEDQKKDKKKLTDAYPEISIIREKSKEDENVYINMEFLGLDLSSIPSKQFADWRTYIIPVLYVITTFISIKLTTAMQKNQKKDNTNSQNDRKEEPDLMMQTNRNMQFMMPVLAVSVSLMAPLGLALYWLTNNVIMIIERILLNIFMKDKEEGENA